MEQQLRYATTGDGVRIAFAVSGSGPPVLHMPNIGVSMLAVEREIPERARWAQLLSQRFSLVRYDARGTGYSQREAADLSAGAHLLDADAVVSELGLESFAVLGFLWSAYIAPYYAARRPERVSSLVLWPPDTRPMSSPEYRSLAELAVSDWETFTETYSHVAMGWEKGEAAHRHASIMRESVSRETFLRQVTEGRVSMSAFASEVAPSVAAPALVLQRRMKYATERVARLVSALPNARLQVLDGEATVPYLGNVRAVVDAIAAFTGVSQEHPARRNEVVVQFPTRKPEVGIALTPREIDILGLLVAGKSNQEIADELVLSVRTVERHLYNIYNKIGASGKSARAAAAAYALNSRLA